MNYNRIKLLLFAADAAYKEGKLKRHQYIKILDDCESNLEAINLKFFEKTTTDILLEYMNI